MFPPASVPVPPEELPPAPAPPVALLPPLPPPVPLPPVPLPEEPPVPLPELPPLALPELPLVPPESSLLLQPVNIAALMLALYGLSIMIAWIVVPKSIDAD